MAYNLGTLKVRVQQKLTNTAFDDASLIQFINDGLRDIVIQSKPKEYQAETTYTTTALANTLTTTATDVLVPFNMRLYTPINYAMLLPYVEYNDVDLMYPNVGLLGTGPPIAWTIYGNTPSVVNNSDQVYTLKSKYLKVPATLASDSDVPLFPETFSEILVLAGYRRALQADDNFFQAQQVQAEIDSQLIDMNLLAKPQLGMPHIMRAPLRRRRLGSR